MRKIICITPIKQIEGAIEALQKHGEMVYDPYIGKENLRRELVDNKFDTIFSNPCKQVFKIDEEVLDGTAVNTICTSSTGTNHIDADYCESHGIKVICIAEDYDVLKTITATAEMAFCLMLALIRNLLKAVEGSSKYEWDYEKYMSRQLDHLTVGIIGYGRLGEIFARFSEPFFKDIFVKDPRKKVPDKYHHVEMDELLEKSDVISIHVHLRKDTYHMIDEEAINKMRDGVYVINTSRGDIVDEKAIIAAVRSGKIKGYAADVISDEYKDGVSNSEMIKAMNEGLNIIISPHICGCTKESQKIAYLHAISKLDRKND
jgi:D-3-phosphoglycerate dehydrogenase / 2-oxoglutarate reductase